MSPQEDNKFLRYWPVVLTLLGVIIYGVRIEGQVNELSGRLRVIETKVEQNDVFNNYVREQLAEINVNLEFIKAELTN